MDAPALHFAPAILTYEWINGQPEGQVLRLKLMKREMYGQTKFDLLLARVLHSTS